MEEQENNTKRRLNTIGMYGMIAGFVFIILAGISFLLHRTTTLQYPDFFIDANVLGWRMLIFGAIVYIIGRVMVITTRTKR